MTVTNVVWVRDQRWRPTLELDLDGDPAHIRSSQRTELLQRGRVDGMSFLASERAAQVPNIHLHGDVEDPYAADLVGCTDDPEVFGLHQQMCAAIRRDDWWAGPRPPTVVESSMQLRLSGTRSRRRATPFAHTDSKE